LLLWGRQSPLGEPGQSACVCTSGRVQSPEVEARDPKDDSAVGVYFTTRRYASVV